jgi:protein TonB
MKSYLSIFAFVCAFVPTTAVFAADVTPIRDGKSCETPKYPKAALVNEESGTVQMAFLVAADGKVVESKLERSSGSKSLDKAALTAFGLCKFKPGTKDGKAEQMWTKVEFVWAF